MEKNILDEKLLKWSDIFEKLVVDAKELTKDLLHGINYVLASGILVLSIVFLNSYLIIRNLHMGSLFILIGLIVILPAVIIVLWNIKKYLDLRKKYSRLYLFQQEMKSG